MNQANVSKVTIAELNCDLAVAQAIALINSYSFDTNGNSAARLVQQWFNYYPGTWIRLAVIEALYLGRYKSVSIEQIMEVWLRIGTPNIHFKGEFERLICGKLSKHLVLSAPFLLDDKEPLFNRRKEDLTSDYWQYSQPNNLLRQESDLPVEEVSSPKHDSKTLTDVKNILKQKVSKQQQLEIKQTHNFLSRQEEANSLRIDKAEELNLEATKTFAQSHLASYSTTITNFHPIIDNSAFFNKLKSLALARI